MVQFRAEFVVQTDRNLLFGVLALQAGLLDAKQFVESCTLWTASKTVSLGDLLVRQRLIEAEDKVHIDYLLERRLQKHDGNASAILSSLPDGILRSLAIIEDVDVQRSLAELPRSVGASLSPTVDLDPRPRERYKLAHVHATGGIGRVWLAHDSDLGREVALKELRPEKAANPHVRVRFLKEARITGQLEHPGIVPVYELVRKAGDQQPFYVMRFINGRTLTEAARAYHEQRGAGQAGSVELLRLLNAFVTVCNTVAYAHSRGVIHRDLKGQNVVLGDFGEVVVLDWGLAKLVDLPDDDAAAAPVMPNQDGSWEVDLTVQGQTIGTPAYMAPEQAAGRPDLVDQRTDVYGLGAILYEVLTGQPPFSGANTQEVLRKVREEEPPSPHHLCSDAPGELEAICLRALAKPRESRCSSAAELAQQVQNWLAEMSERKQADQERARFFGLSLDLMCIADFQGYFKQLNPAWEKTLGWSIAELMGRPWSDFLHPDDVAPTVAAAQHVMQGNELPFHENRYLCKDGSFRWLHWTAQEIVGQQLMYAVARDVTERKQAEETLRTSEERYRSVVAAMQDGIVFLDADGSIRTCNAAAERILGLSAGQMTGRTPLDPRWGAIHEDGSVFPGDEHPPMVTLRTGQPCTGVIMGVRKPDGSLTWLSINSQPQFQADGTNLTGVVVSIEDITEQKRAKAALAQANEELTLNRKLLRS